ncbi:hypothetical protein LTR70_009582 [Exophiala xenobiotica]|uniref:Mid2 domain-containing protein n=1 Tax=Lithohypha guttulata TaxID=1690604 RepID=A0ABR0JZ96_9EURO|nr:hypothetical protein LTR24_009201 [Lithohypha guttulata]KAK5310298.1 hypothetical protein LTR70_009582 [Exophiala xenobiotica]
MVTTSAEEPQATFVYPPAGDYASLTPEPINLFDVLQVIWTSHWQQTSFRIECQAPALSWDNLDYNCADGQAFCLARPSNSSFWVVMERLLGDAPWEKTDTILCLHVVLEYGSIEGAVYGEKFTVTSQDGTSTTFSTSSGSRSEATSSAGTISANSLSSTPSTQASSSPITSTSTRPESTFSSTIAIPSKLDQTGLTTGVTAGISVGTSLGLLLVAACLFFLIGRKRKRARAARKKALANDVDHEKPELETGTVNGDDAKPGLERSKTDHELEPSQAEHADRSTSFTFEALGDQRLKIHELGSGTIHEMSDASKQS